MHDMKHDFIMHVGIVCVCMCVCASVHTHVCMHAHMRAHTHIHVHKRLSEVECRKGNVEELGNRVLVPSAAGIGRDKMAATGMILLNKTIGWKVTLLLRFKCNWTHLISIYL